MTQSYRPPQKKREKNQHTISKTVVDNGTTTTTPTARQKRAREICLLQIKLSPRGLGDALQRRTSINTRSERKAGGGEGGILPCTCKYSADCPRVANLKTPTTLLLLVSSHLGWRSSGAVTSGSCDSWWCVSRGMHSTISVHHSQRKV